MNDPVVAEVRKAREEYARQFNYDLHAMCEDLRREQERSGGPVVSFPKKRVRAFVISDAAQAGTTTGPSLDPGDGAT